MKYSVKLLMLLVIGLIFPMILSGCAKKEQEKQDLLSVIKSRGNLIVGVKYDSKPFGFIDQDQQVKGFDVDLCREIAKRLLGDENAIKFTQVTSSNRIFSISSGTVDFAAATMTITPKRSRVLDFSEPYYIAGQAIVIPKDSPIKKLEDLEHKKIIVVLGATSGDVIKELVPNAKILGFRTYTDAFSALRSGRGDALTTDDTIIYGFLMENPKFVMLKERYTKEPYGLGFKKSSKTALFRENVNSILAEMRIDGTLTKLQQKWTENINNNIESN